jgi:hypothetical protein
MTQLHFAGDWSPSVGLCLGLALAVLAWILYRRETRQLPSRKAALLPWLRAAAILLLTLMLTGPVLRHRHTTGTLTRLICCADSSLSMGITDPDLELPRKLAIAEGLGWLPAGAVPKDAALAADTLGRAIAALNQASAAGTAMPEALEVFSTAITAAQTLLRKAGLSENAAAQMDRELCLPVREMLKQPAASEADLRPLKQASLRFVEAAGRWQKEGLQIATTTATRLVTEDRSAAAAVQRFDTTPRSERLASLLLGGGKDSLLAQLGARFDVQLWSLEGKEGRQLWSAVDGESQLPGTLPEPKSQTTNLSGPLLAGIGEQKTGSAQTNRFPWQTSSPVTPPPRTAVVVFSDGQHNSGASPHETAKLLGDRRIPIIGVGLGQTATPGDLAITGLESPDSVFYEDRVRGSLTIKEDIKKGSPLVVRIHFGDRLVWEQILTTSGQHLRKLPFDFPVKELMAQSVDAVRKPNTGISVSAVALPFVASVVAFPGEREIRNNSARFQVRATNRRRKMLLLDGRPRWETRYLRNLFERDPQWEVNTLLAGTGPENVWRRGELPGTFPQDERTLHSYDLIVFGEVPRERLKDEELKWISNFVAERGGGLFLVDGRRGVLRQYVDSPLGATLPVRFAAHDTGSEHSGFPATKLLPTTRAATLAPFTLSTSHEKAAVIWETLPPPRWVARCTALPGTETLLEATQGQDSGPAMVTRLFGAGRVVYAGFDESWRWRIDVAGLYQDRFWNQLIPWIAEPPFALQNERVSLDVGPFLYSPGDVAELRARVRDAKGAPITDSKISGVLWRDGVQTATLMLESDESHHGVFRCRTAPLEPGHYEFSIDSRAAGPSEARLRLNFEVDTRDTGELSDLRLNEESLQRMAAESRGHYLHEEQASRLLEILAPFQEGKAVETETVLWQSYGWFLAVLALFSTEWALRKRLGLI